MARSRPLRFLGVVAFGWVTMRVAMLWPSPALTVPLPADKVGRIADLIGGLARIDAAADEPVTRDMSVAKPFGPRLADFAAARNSHAAFVRPGRHQRNELVALASIAPLDRPQESAVGLPRALANRAPPVAPSQHLATRVSRWSGSAWLIVRHAGPAMPFVGQLGGSQAGARIAYMLDTRRRIAAVARVAGALASRDTQASLGLEWQPSRAPIRLFVEHRITIEGGRSGPAAGAIAGLNPIRLPRGFTLEGYGQAGAIARSGIEGFADGSVHAARPIADIGRVRIEGGLGAWGGVQRGASRIDIGPSIAAIVPIASQRVRMTIDWRQRVAGSARPASGPALSIGADF